MTPRVRINIIKADEKEIVYTYCIEYHNGEVCVGGIIPRDEEIIIEPHELTRLPEIK